MNTTDLLKKVRKIEIKTKGLSNHIFAGEYHSAFKGRGMSFSEVREYQYGDDVRAIDWNVTARFNQPYIKVFEEERELTVMLLVDMSSSSFFGSVEQRKKEMLTEICAVMSFSAINNNDKVGVIFFTDRVEKFIPPKKGKSHILRIISEFIQFEPEGTGTDINGALQYFNNIIKKRSIAFLLSDFMDHDYKDNLAFAKRRHDLVGIKLFDPLEVALPNVGLLKTLDAETQQTKWLDTSKQSVRADYAANYLQYDNYCTQAFQKCGADKMSIATNESYVQALMKFFKRREGKK